MLVDEPSFSLADLLTGFPVPHLIAIILPCRAIATENSPTLQLVIVWIAWVGISALKSRRRGFTSASGFRINLCSSG